MSFDENIKLRKFIDRICEQFLDNQKEKPFFNNIEKIFKKDLLVNLDNKLDFLEVQNKLKKWKDILSRRISLISTPSSLVEISEKLANFNYKSGIELPGQYLEIETEPFPEKRILISRFEPNIFSGGINKRKKIIIRTNTGKRLMFAILYNHVRLYSNGLVSDERITQFKVFLNKIFSYMHPESMRRGVKLGIFKKIVFPNTKLYEENNLNFIDEIYKI
jgi:hypothetical protein